MGESVEFHSLTHNKLLGRASTVHVRNVSRYTAVLFAALLAGCGLGHIDEQLSTTASKRATTGTTAMGQPIASNPEQ
jgi:hypothetical protein